MKGNLAKYGAVIESLGKTIRDYSMQVADGADMISGETDIKIFIEHHRSDNPIVQKEVF